MDEKNAQEAWNIELTAGEEVAPETFEELSNGKGDDDNE